MLVYKNNAQYTCMNNSIYFSIIHTNIMLELSDIDKKITIINVHIIA